MTKDPLTREDVVKHIANAAYVGNLGFFVGTGFSKAVSAGALSFDELISQLAERLGFSICGERYRRKSCPQIVSELISEYSNGSPRAVDTLTFKEKVADLCNLRPESDEIQNTTAEVLKKISPSWIITTNYDLLLETFLAERGVSVLPGQPLIANAKKIPIYHIHGYRLAPTTIKITEEDYVDLVGPLNYQRLKLPLLLCESTTVFLGYSFGDINVKSAVAWAKSFKEGRTAQALVQALYVKNIPKPPYLGSNGEIVLEINDIPSFLTEISQAIDSSNKERKTVEEAVRNLLAQDANIENLLSSSEMRDKMSQILVSILPLTQISDVINFFNKALEPVWGKARTVGGFRYYAVYLNILISIAKNIKVEECSPVLINYIADALDRVGTYIDHEKKPGSSYIATDTWLARHKEMSGSLKTEFRSYAENNGKKDLIRMLDLIE